MGPNEKMLAVGLRAVAVGVELKGSDWPRVRVAARAYAKGLWPGARKEREAAIDFVIAKLRRPEAK